MHGPLGLLDNHLGAAPQEDRHSLRVLALLDHQHAVLKYCVMKRLDQDHLGGRQSLKKRAVRNSLLIAIRNIYI